MKFHLNIAPAPLAAAALLASAFTTSSVAATRLGFTYHDHDGDHTTKKATAIEDELIGRKLNVNASATTEAADATVEPYVNASSVEVEAMRKGSGSKKSKKRSDTCYIGQKFLDEFDKDPSARCCLMPPPYYSLLDAVDPNLAPELAESGCKNVDSPPYTSLPERPVCYETAFQISLWLLWTKSGADGDTPVTDYPVCDGTVISPGLFTSSGNLNLPSVLTGIIDSPLVVSIPDLNLFCEGDDHGCTFDGGEYQILSFPALPFPDFATGAPPTFVPDTSNLKIEGFTFTGEMKSVNDDNRFTYSIYLSAAGKNMSIVNNIFADVTGPVGEEISASGKCRTKGYYALAANPSTDDNIPFAYNIGILEIHVSMEDNEFHDIDVGSYPVYAPEDPKKCSFCYYEKETVALNGIIYNVGQNVSLKRNTFKDITAGPIYNALPPGIFLTKYKDESGVEAKYGCPQPEGKPCYEAVIEDNTFKKNDVRSLVDLQDSKSRTSTVTLSNNEGECDQTYTGGAYCPLRFRVRSFVVGSVKSFVDFGGPFENCGLEFCLTEERVMDSDGSMDPGVCGEFTALEPSSQPSSPPSSSSSPSAEPSSSSQPSSSSSPSASSQPSSQPSSTSQPSQPSCAGGWLLDTAYIECFESVRVTSAVVLIKCPSDAEKNEVIGYLIPFLGATPIPIEFAEFVTDPTSFSTVDGVTLTINDADGTVTANPFGTNLVFATDACEFA